MLFQGGALLDSMTVFDNLALPLRELERLDEPAIAAAVHDRLDAVGLHDVDGLLPSQLSGGMVKRVALARAIIRSPAVLLCDEPFSGLDPLSSRRIESLLANINARRGITTVVVSHDIASTMRMAEHVLLLLPTGYVQGTPAELEASPDPLVRAFLRPDEAALALPEAS
jgi:phospholipid/cholesterol/gamma-HCH transport system ATP-binding protein